MSTAIYTEQLYGSDREASIHAAAALCAMASEASHGELFRALQSDNAAARNAVALAVHDQKLQAALPYLIEAIKRPENFNHRGTMVYALAALDCRDHFLFLFDLALTGNFECRAGAIEVLWNQGFSVSDEDLDNAAFQLDRIRDDLYARDGNLNLAETLQEILFSLR